MSKKNLTKQCENCYLMISKDTLFTGPFMLCRVCSERYIANLGVAIEPVE